MALVYILAALGAVVAAGALVSTLRIGRLRRRRTGGQADFVQSFSGLGIGDDIPTVVYRFYASHGIWKNFPFSRDDRFSEVLYDDPDTIDDDARTLAEQLGVRLPPGYICQAYPAGPIQTLGDMVFWLDWIRRHQVPSTRA
jgi:hypothetical protein